MPASPSAWSRLGAFTSPSFSKDGATIFHLRGNGLPQVWACDRDGGNARQLSDHDEKVAFLRRSPASDALAWGIDAGGDERQQIWLLEPGGTPRALTAAPRAIHDFGAWSPDGARIAYAANDRDERIFDLCVMDVATGATKRLLEGNGILSITSWGSTGRLAFIEDRSSSDQSLRTIDVDTGATEEVPRSGLARYASIRWESDGRNLAGLTDQGGADFMRLCRIDPETGDLTTIYAAPHRDVEAWSMSPDGTLLATVENDRGYAILRVGVLGTDRAPVAGLPPGIVADLAWAPDSAALAFTAQGPTDPPAIFLWDAKTHQVRCVARPAPVPGIDPGALVPFELVSWTSYDGRSIPGWFARPATPPPASGYRTVVWVHGGPAAQTRANFRADMQMLLDQGYAVLMPNVRGSTGYGRASMESDDVELRPDAIADLVAGHAWLVAQPDIDPERIGIMGQSYGGWMVLAAIALHPGLWRAAVDYYGIADFVTELEHTGVWRSDHRAREYGFPGTDDALFRKISPIHHANDITAPLLVAHGDRDPRVPMEESDQIVTALELRQHKVRYERFTYAGHGFIRPDHKARIYQAVADHFATHL